jgi:hypothetical protein
MGRTKGRAMTRPRPRLTDLAVPRTPSVAERRRTLSDHAGFAVLTAAAAVRTVARALLQEVIPPNGGAAPEQPRAATPPNSPQLAEADHVVEFVYELLDAHSDTARLASVLPVDQFWGAHLDYLRTLQRKGRELLAQTSAERSG